MISNKNSIGICKKKRNYYQTRNILGIIDVKDQIWYTNVKYVWLSLNISWALVFYRYTCMYSFIS